jgi:hypothetical protein
LTVRKNRRQAVGVAVVVVAAGHRQNRVIIAAVETKLETFAL